MPAADPGDPEQLSPSFNAPRPADGPNADLTPAAPPRADASYERLEQKLSDLASTVGRWQKDLDDASSRSSRLEGAFSVLLSSLEGWKSDIREVASRTESRVLRGLEVIDSRIARVQPTGAKTDQVDVLAAIDRLERTFSERIRSIEARPSKTDLPAGLLEGLSRLDKRLTAIEQAVSSHNDQLAARLAAGLEGLNRPDDQADAEALASTLRRLENKLTDTEDALTRKLDSVLAEGDENSATQLRYLAGLEELQATLAKRVQSLESVMTNPLDAKQWERLAKGLEFLDSKLAQGYDFIANRLDTAIASLTATLDNRSAAGQEANLKSAERLWRALRGLEDQITGSYQMVRQSQERLEAATQELSGGLDELRALTGARAGHTEKFLMEGLENLDGRFNHSLMAVAENLGNALFALNKATGEWRSELFNSTEESEERVVGSISQAEAKLSRELKAGLDSLGRREERMLALILGGGAPLPAAELPQPESSPDQPAGSGRGQPPEPGD